MPSLFCNSQSIKVPKSKNYDYSIVYLTINVHHLLPLSRYTISKKKTNLGINKIVSAPDRNN